MELPSIIRDLGESLVAPRQVIQILIAERRGLTFGFFIVLLCSILIGATATMVFISKLISFVPLGILSWIFGNVAILFGIASFVILSIGYWLIGGLIIHIFCKLLKGNGLFEHTLVAFSYLWLPSFLIGLIAPALMFLDYLTSLGLFLLMLCISFIWGVILSVQALAEAHNFSVSKALLSMLAPILILIFIFATLFSLKIFVWW